MSSRAVIDGRAPPSVLVLVDPLLEDLPPRRGYLALQIREAAASIVSNVAEGAGELASKEKRPFRPPEHDPSPSRDRLHAREDE